MDWNQLREHLVATRQVLGDDGERVMVVEHHLDPDTDKRLQQRVEVSLSEVLRAPWIAFIADVCAIDLISPHRALVHNGTLAVGSIYIDEHYYFLRHAVPLATLTQEHLGTIIELLAHEAARLRAKRPLTVAPANGVFDAYAD